MTQRYKTDTSMQLRIPKETYDRIKKVASDDRRTIHNTIVIALEDLFKHVKIAEEKQEAA